MAEKKTEKELIAWEKELDQREAELNKKAASLEIQEKKAANSYQKLFEEKFSEIKTGLDEREKNLSGREVKIANEEIAHKAKMDKYTADVIEKLKAQTEKIRNDETTKLTEELNKLRDSNSDLIQQLNAKIASLTEELNTAKNDSAVAVSTQKSNTNTIAKLNEQVSSLTSDNEKNKQKVSALEEEKSVLEETAGERLTLITKLQNDIKKYETLEKLLDGKPLDYYIKEISDLKEKTASVNQKAAENDEKENDLEFQERMIKTRLTRLEQKEADFDSHVEAVSKERISTLETEIENLRQEKESYRSQLETFKQNNRTFEEYEELGEKADLLKENESLKEEIKEIAAKIKRFPSQYIEMELNDIEESKERLQADKIAIEEREKACVETEKENISLKQQLNDANFRLTETIKSNETLTTELNRFTAGNIQDIENERQRRVAEINKPLLAFSGVNRPKRRPVSDEKVNEKEWLEGIKNNIKDFGLYFSDRILKAFHTALKCSDISPLTVLGGTSGTGKSELVRLYSHFGGLTFLNLPVQPDWDCQEDMLGFFNSIDNRFEAQDVLRLLAQSQRSPDDQEGLNDVMTVVLLDEMNLSNPELYFAEFLSKLETRRGLDEDHLPSISVKIGSGLQPEPISLGKNVLWTGTMNNDETTKTLSDKVIDRGILINFPRPKTLERRVEKKELGQPAPLLLRDTWKSWTQAAVKFSDEEIKEYKETVQKINDELGKAGRGLGHRVWQSIETYMSNYPDVIDAFERKDEKAKKAAMDIAFEDQIVQKVMPKLRGLENRGTQGDVLDAIQGLIPPDLSADYENAKNMSYGQFMWCTSDYMNETAKEEASSAENTEKAENADKADKAEGGEDRAKANAAGAGKASAADGLVSYDYEEVKAKVAERLRGEENNRNKKGLVTDFLKRNFTAFAEDKAERNKVFERLNKDLHIL